MPCSSVVSLACRRRHPCLTPSLFLSPCPLIHLADCLSSHHDVCPRLQVWNQETTWNLGDSGEWPGRTASGTTLYGRGQPNRLENHDLHPNAQTRGVIPTTAICGRLILPTLSTEDGQACLWNVSVWVYYGQTTASEQSWTRAIRSRLQRRPCSRLCRPLLAWSSPCPSRCCLLRHRLPSSPPRSWSRSPP